MQINVLYPVFLDLHLRNGLQNIRNKNITITWLACPSWITISRVEKPFSLICTTRLAKNKKIGNFETSCKNWHKVWCIYHIFLNLPSFADIDSLYDAPFGFLAGLVNTTPMFVNRKIFPLNVKWNLTF